MYFKGGGSSDIFAGSEASTPRSVKNHMKSNIFAVPSPIRSQGNHHVITKHD